MTLLKERYDMRATAVVKTIGLRRMKFVGLENQNLGKGRKDNGTRSRFTNGGMNRSDIEESEGSDTVKKRTDTRGSASPMSLGKKERV